MKKTFTVRDLPPSERPRERLSKFGPAALSVQELLALLLGKGTNGESVLTTAQKILNKFGNLEDITQASYQDFRSIKGLGTAKTSQLIACFEIARRLSNNTSRKKGNRQLYTDPQQIFNDAKLLITDFSREHLLLFSLDSRFNLISTDIIGIGTLNANLIHPREIFDMAIRRHAAYIILVHNHPSGLPEPSDEDIEVTKRIKVASTLMGIPLLDHIIITRQNYFSITLKK